MPGLLVMSRRLSAWALVTAGLTLLITGTPALAQQVTGTPGSPDATTTIDGRYLPSPPQPFRGRSS
jgi:hypothetical protein